MTDGLDDTSATAEIEYTINITETNKKTFKYALSWKGQLFVFLWC